MKSFGFRWLIVLIIMFSSLVSWAETISVQIESTDVIAGKPFTISFRIEDPSQQYLPDFSELEQDFTILSTGSSTRITIINGQRQSELVWTVTLQTNQVGKVTIPSIQFGPLKSKSTTITVADQPQRSNANTTSTKSSKNAPVFLKAEVNNATPYINEAVTYTVKLYRQRGVFINGSYQQQQVDNALVVPLHKTQDTKILADGRAFLVESMTYAIYPNDKGKLIIKPPSLQGTVSDIYMRRFQISANEVTLDVKPIPQSASKFWLPAESVTLTQQFSQDTSHLKQGDTVIRTISLSAKGIPAQLMPDIKLPATSNAKVYIEKPERDNTATSDEVTGTLHIKVTYLLNQPGMIELPPLSIRWFNTNTRKFETAHIAKEKWQVELDAAKGNSQSSHEKPTYMPSQKAVSVPTSQPKKITQSRPWGLFWLFGILVIGGGLFWWHIKKKTPEVNASKNEFAGERKVRQKLKSACLKNDGKAAKEAIIMWAVQHYDKPKLMNLTQVSSLIGHRGLNKAIQALNQALYSPNQQQNWQGESLWLAWQDFTKTKKRRNTKNHQSLSPMFPEN